MSRSIPALGAIALLGLAQPAPAGEAATFAEAQALAAEQNKPLLVDFFTEW